MISAEEKQRLQDRQDRFNELYRPGGVFRIQCDFPKGKKYKRILVLSTNPELKYFIINSKVNSFLEKKHILWDLQVKIDPMVEDIVDHESYINCSELHSNGDYDVTKIKIKNFAMDDNDCMLGILSNESMSYVKDSIRTSKVLTPNEATKLLRSIDEYY